MISRCADRLRATAPRLVDQLAIHPGITIVPQTPELFAAALRLYGEREDKSWSLTDCASCLIMEARSMRQALAHDRHFEQMGFEALLRME